MAGPPRAVIIRPGYIGAVHGEVLRRNGVDVFGFVGSGSEVGRGRAETPFTARFSARLPTRHRPTRPVETYAVNELSPDEYELAAFTTEDYGSVLVQLDGGARGAMTVSQVSTGLRSLRLGDAIAQSARVRRWVSPSLEIDS